MKTIFRTTTILILLILHGLSHEILAQNVGINNDGSLPNASAMLDIKSSDKGLLIPRAQTTAINSPVIGLMVFQPSDSKFYYFNGAVWVSFNSIVYDADNDTGIDVERTSDEDKIRFDVKGKEALLVGNNNANVITFNTQGFNNKYNLFIGNQAGFNTGLDSTFINSAKFNTGIGDRALAGNTNGLDNVALGSLALFNNTTGSSNTAIGNKTLVSNISGFANTAIGIGAIGSNVTGQYNVGVGQNALSSNKTGTRTVAIGSRSATFDTLATHSVYIGANAGAGGQTLAFKHQKKTM